MMNGFILQENTSILISRNGKTLYSILHRSLDLTDCFETKFIQSVKEMKKVERAFYLSLLFALFMLLLSYIGLLFRQRIFAWLFRFIMCFLYYFDFFYGVSNILS